MNTSHNTMHELVARYYAAATPPSGARIKQRRSQVNPDPSQDRRVCHYCTALLDAKTRTRDHIVPLAADGQQKRWNIVWACRTCNEAKADRLIPNHCDYCRDAIAAHQEGNR